MTKQMSRNGSLVLLHIVVLIFGFTGIIGKELSMGTVPIVFYRTLIAGVALFLYARIRRIPVEMSPRLMLRVVFIGFVIAAHWISFFEAIKQSNISVTLAALATTSLFVAFLDPLINRRKIDRVEVALGVGVFIGIVFVFRVDASYHLGLMLALFSAFLAAVFAIFNSVFVRQTSSTSISVVEMLSACVVVFLYLLFDGQMNESFFIISHRDLTLLLVLGLVATAFAFLASVEVMKNLSAFTVSLTVNLEPIYSIVLALILYKEEEQMTPSFYIGAAIILLTLFLNSWHRGKKK